MVLNGIDTASYQTGMGKTKGDFRIVKATEGTGYVNPDFKSQMKTAPALTGVYHFGSNGDPESEAKHFLATVKAYIGKSLLVLDYEQKPISVSWAKKWLDYVYKATGIKPLIYLGLGDENAHDWSSVVKANYGVWIAQYNNYNSVSGFKPRSLYGSLRNWKSMAMFQYTSSGKLTGWGGNLDFNVFYGDKSTWSAYVKPAKTTPAKRTYMTWNPKYIYTKKQVLAYKDPKNVGSGKHVAKVYKKHTQLVTKKLNGKTFQLDNGLYITSNDEYVSNTYYVPGHDLKQVKSLKATGRYDDLDFKKKNASFPKGTCFDVKKVVKYGKASRIQLANGNYISANKLINKMVK